jgi:hypothetical protein
MVGQAGMRMIPSSARAEPTDRLAVYTEVLRKTCSSVIPHRMVQLRGPIHRSIMSAHVLVCDLDERRSVSQTNCRGQG